MDRNTLDNKLYEVIRACNGMPNPVTLEWCDEAGKAGMIRKADLKDGTYYYGNCRNARVAKWNKDTQNFTYMRSKFGSVFPEDINHPEDDNGFDVFFPVSEVEPTPEEKIKE